MPWRNELHNYCHWGIRPDVLESLARQASGETPSAWEASAERSPAAGDHAAKYRVENGVAIIPVRGPLMKRDTPHGHIERHLGWSTYASIQRDMGHALQAPEVRAILLDVDSPGGVVDGCAETGVIIAQAGQVKPVYAYAADVACSAAYWLASQARHLACTETGVLGSIGVLAVHWDISGFDQQLGIKRTYLAAGEFKALGNDAEPLSEDARQKIEAELQAIYSVFLAAVSRGRGTDEAHTRGMAEGRVYIGSAAVEVGLADALLTRAELMESISKEVNMDLNELRAQHPGLVQQLEAEQTAQAEAAIASAQATATSEERQRLVALVEACMDPEAAGKLKAMLEAGVSAEQAQAMGVRIAATQNTGETSREQILQGLQRAASPPVASKQDNPQAESPLLADAKKRGGKQ